MSSSKTTRVTLSHWLGLIRFSHTIFALPFAAMAVVLALATPLASGGLPTFRFRDLFGVLLCMVFARSAAMAFNRLVDARIDAENPRTKKRHLPAGILTSKQVVFFTLLCSAGFIGSTLMFLPNRLPLYASIPVLLFLMGYSLAKRFTAAAHLWLGIALSLSPICAWVAIRGVEVVGNPIDLLTPTTLAVAIAAWVCGFDIIYACQDAEYDAGKGLHSVPAKLGIAGALRIAAISHVIMLVVLSCLPVVGATSGLGWLFGATLLVIAGLVLRQHSLVRPDDLDRVNEAFFDMNALISVLLLVAGTLDCLWVQ